MLALIDVLYCGYCGRKMTNGSKYNYWTIKGTNEKRTSKIAIYKCQDAWQGVPHDKTKQIRADKIEPIVFNAIAQYIGKLQENENIFQQIENNQEKEKKSKEKELKKEKESLEKIQKKIMIMEEHIPDAMTGEYPLSLQELVTIIKKHKEQLQEQQKLVSEKEAKWKAASVSVNDWEDIKSKLPSWQDIFLNADTATKRVLVNKLIERIDVKKDEIIVRFKVNLNDFFVQPRTSDGFGVQKSRIRIHHHVLHRLRPEVDLRPKYFRKHQPGRGRNFQQLSVKTGCKTADFHTVL